MIYLTDKGKRHLKNAFMSKHLHSHHLAFEQFVAPVQNIAHIPQGCVEGEYSLHSWLKLQKMGGNVSYSNAYFSYMSTSMVVTVRHFRSANTKRREWRPTRIMPSFTSGTGLLVDWHLTWPLMSWRSGTECWLLTRFGNSMYKAEGFEQHQWLFNAIIHPNT